MQQIESQIGYDRYHFFQKIGIIADVDLTINQLESIEIRSLRSESKDLLRQLIADFQIEIKK
jgi:hypothetical protein